MPLGLSPVLTLLAMGFAYHSGHLPREGGLQVTLTPAHVLLGQPLPAEWKTPENFWAILRPVLCWQVWKSGNEHFMADRRSDHRRTIRKSWHRIGMYLRKEWRHISKKVHLGRISLIEVTSRMHSQFGSNMEIWDLHGLVLQIPSVPPRRP